MWKIIRRRKRAISPVVTTIFLFGVIIGAIAVSLGIIYPAVNELNDQILLETSGSSMQTLDNGIQSLILNGAGSSIFTSVDVGSGGTLQYDNRTQSLLQLTGGASGDDIFKINHSRLQIVQTVNTNWFAEGSSQYFAGAGNQDILFLNTTNQRNLSWSIINQTRPVDSDQVTTSLYYRNLVSSSSILTPSQTAYNVTIKIQMVNFTLSSNSETARSGSNLGLNMNFIGSTTQFTDWKDLDDHTKLQVITRFPGSENTISTETPIQVEAPGSESVDLSLRFQFVYHTIELTI